MTLYLCGMAHYVCELCGRMFADNEAQVELTSDQLVIPAMDHHEGLPVKEHERKATCLEPGSHELVTYCLLCHEELSRQSETTPALGHKWNSPVYTWSADNRSCTGKRVCANDASHYESETAISTVTRKEPTVEEPGEEVYTVAFNNKVFEHQTKTVVLPRIEYHVVDGEGSSWTQGSNSSLVLTFKRTWKDDQTFRLFKGILIDGKTVESTGNYSAREGSVILTLLPAYLSTLSTGRHTVTAQFEDGEAAASFVITSRSSDNNPVVIPVMEDPSKRNRIPNTADGFHPEQWLLLMGISAVMALWCLRKLIKEY